MISVLNLVASHATIKERKVCEILPVSQGRKDSRPYAILFNLHNLGGYITLLS